MNRQEIFDKVARHLLTQNARSVRGPSCAYLGEGGLKCAVGCLIADEYYSPDLERRNALDGRVLSAVAASLGHPLDVDSQKLLHELQLTHDFSFPNTWRTGSLLGIAREFDLRPDVLKEFQ